MTTTQNKEMREYIFNEMNAYVAMCSADRYGQLSTMDVYSVFKSRTDEVLEYLKQDPMIRVSTYGGRFGSYKGIGGLHDIQDEEMREACKWTWARNKSRLQNQNQW
jgi:hypothetical protein